MFNYYHYYYYYYYYYYSFLLNCVEISNFTFNYQEIKINKLN